VTSNKGERRKASPAISGEQLDALVTRVKAGETEAFEQLYRIYGRRIVNYTYRLTGSTAEAEDLTQETFIQAYRKIKSLKENRKFQSWLFRIAQNLVYQKYRGKRPHVESIDAEGSHELSDFQKLATPLKSPEEGVLADELGQMIEQVIQELPEKYRQVFVLSAVQKMSYQEISEIVGRSLAAVKSDIHRARVSVREKIKAYLGENYGMSNLF
jgi:RNA polymerase sigma-70 factor (ECF subfamily)